MAAGTLANIRIQEPQRARGMGPRGTVRLSSVSTSPMLRYILLLHLLWLFPATFYPVYRPACPLLLSPFYSQSLPPSYALTAKLLVLLYLNPKLMSIQGDFRLYSHGLFFFRGTGNIEQISNRRDDR